MVPLPPQTKGKRGAQKKSTLSWRKTHVKSVVQWNIQTKEVLQEARCFHPVTSFECNLWSFFLQLSCIKQNGFAFQLSGGSFADCFREGPGTFFWQKQITQCSRSRSHRLNITGWWTGIVTFLNIIHSLKPTMWHPKVGQIMIFQLLDFRGRVVTFRESEPQYKPFLRV